MKKKKRAITIEKPEGLGFWATREEYVFADEHSLCEMYGLLGAKLREISGRLGGRPRDKNKQRCPCNEMTLARAIARHHQCSTAKE
jgi:hypothetical protein